MPYDFFTIGSRVTKVGGDYAFEGTVQGIVVKRSGAVRYVVEDDRGVLFIFSANKLKAI